MPLAKTLYAESRDVPLDNERNWGTTVTGILADSIDGLDGVTLLLSSGVALLKVEPTDTSLAASATLTVTHPVHRVQSTGGAVVLDTTTAIADGDIDGQILVLFGVSDADTVEIRDGANTKMNGDVILTDGVSITYHWDATNSLWREQTRNN